MLTSYTATSISSPKRSIQFPFDADLFVSRIYQRWIRGSLKKSLHEQQHDTPYPQPYSWSWKEDAERRKRSEAIDRLLEDDSKRLRREIRILLLGSESKAEIVKQMKMNHAKGYSEKELQSYRPTIFTYVCECAGVVASAIRQFGMAPKSDPIWGHTDYISTYVLDPKPYGLDPKFMAALELIRHSPDYAKLMNHSEFHLPDSAEYFFSDLGRIAADDYLPNDMDIMQTRTNTTGIADVQFQMGSISIHMFDIANQWSNRKKWIHYFESIKSVIFVVDLDTYDQVQLEDCSRNKMLESLMQFDSVVNSKWFADTSIILLLNNVTQFKDKLQRSPLGNYFPDYSGGDDINKGGKYILLRFTQINRAYLDIYPRLIDSDDVANIQLVFAAVKETILNNALKRTSDLLS
ncbi:guanine nucleotide binding protein, alpha subunit [Thozetella sp. PMI_491]|nr:guanine nucleotide binding protein, alpha subunit [Thozetella sp. PMI_491]